ncbi:hypothetical protein E2C01_008150 [Portunus trituberculatus]|uniref:Uncharacterized protein n=1 Tax=Portunus trituberculatus TaxID=210409 RepID=A0A5B7D011_PORTR|nr:hypothetical protein [Portunus trituberculatus]
MAYENNRGRRAKRVDERALLLTPITFSSADRTIATFSRKPASQPSTVTQTPHCQTLHLTSTIVNPFNTGTQFYLEICVRLDHFTDIMEGLWRSED